MNAFDLGLLTPFFLECVNSSLNLFDLILGNTHFAQRSCRIGLRLRLRFRACFRACFRARFREFPAEFVSGTHETVFLSDAYECHVELLQHVLCDVLLQIYTNLRQQASRLVVRHPLQRLPEQWQNLEKFLFVVGVLHRYNAHSCGRVFAGEAVAVGNVDHVHERAGERENSPAETRGIPVFDAPERVPVLAPVVKNDGHRGESAEGSVFAVYLHHGIHVSRNLVERAGIAPGLVLCEDTHEQGRSCGDFHAEGEVGFSGLFDIGIRVGDAHERVEVHLRDELADFAVHLAGKFQQEPEPPDVGKKPSEKGIMWFWLDASSVFVFGSVFPICLLHIEGSYPIDVLTGNFFLCFLRKMHPIAP